MATNFSPCKGSYVLNQFPSNVMFGMNGFHVLASGAIQGHHGPLVVLLYAQYFDLSSADLFKHFVSRSSTAHCPVLAYFHVFHRLIWDSIPAVDHDHYHCFDLIVSAF